MKLKDAARLYKGEHLLNQFADLAKGKRRYSSDTVSWGLDKLTGKDAKLPMKDGKVDGSKIPKKNRAPGWNYTESREMTSKEKKAQKAEMDSPPTSNSQGFKNVDSGTMKKASDRNPDWQKEYKNKAVRSPKSRMVSGGEIARGVHGEHYKGRPGESTVGMQIRDKASMMLNPKERHQEKLAELKAQPKPNLPKMEKAKMDRTLSGDQVRRRRAVEDAMRSHAVAQAGEQVHLPVSVRSKHGANTALDRKDSKEPSQMGMHVGRTFGRGNMAEAKFESKKNLLRSKFSGKPNLPKAEMDEKAPQPQAPQQAPKRDQGAEIRAKNRVKWAKRTARWNAWKAEQKKPKLDKAREDQIAPPEARGQYRQERRKFEPRDHMADDLTSEKGVSDTGIEIRRADKRNPGVLSHGYARVQEPEKHKQNAANRIRERLAMARMNRAK